MRFGIWLCLAIMVGAAMPASAAEMTVDISIAADATKADGSPWDGIPGLSSKLPVPNSNGPPDIAVCVVQTTGGPECYWRSEGAKKFSFCQNSNTCTIESVAIPRLPAGLLIFDVDLAEHDLIDVVVLTGGSAVAGEAERVELNLRAAVDSLTPAFTEGERQRRWRKLNVLPVSQCTGPTAACRLTQSEFRLLKR